MIYHYSLQQRLRSFNELLQESSLIHESFLINLIQSVNLMACSSKGIFSLKNNFN